ncbi:ATPase [Pseudomonas floridensis]|uniref:ATPase n=1 Tax=Pseudomonas floridensis TaxID=1958950 RepID=A0A1X0N3H2_9PSED|nr:ATPase [Pseudomonas floridensis]ORC58061.1 ATPase [Pseudomonas floridensis]
MKIFNLLTVVAVLLGAPLATSSVSAASHLDTQACYLQPVTDSATSLQHTQSVGVLYSENTVSNLQYLTRYHAVAERSARNPALDARIRDAFISSSDPKLAIDWLTASLQNQFASVTVYDNLDALIQARPDVVVMLDTYNRLVSKRNNQVEARYMARFYDTNLQYIGKAEGVTGRELPSVWVKGKAAAEIAAQIDQQRELQVTALKQFDASLKALVMQAERAQVAAN